MDSDDFEALMLILMLDLYHTVQCAFIRGCVCPSMVPVDRDIHDHACFSMIMNLKKSKWQEQDHVN